MKFICNATHCNAVTVDEVSFSDILTDPEEEPSACVEKHQEVSADALQGPALTNQEWQGSTVDSLIEGHRSSTEDTDS